MNRKLISLLTAILFFTGISATAVNTDNLRRGSHAPRLSTNLPAPSRTPDWAPKMISTDCFKCLSSGRTILTQSSLVTPQPQNLITSPSGAAIYGLRAQSTDPDFKYGWYEITTDGRQELVWSSDGVESVGFVRNGELFAFFSVELWGSIVSNWTSYNLADGSIIDKGDLATTDYSQMILSAVYDEWEDVAYVYTYNADMTGALIQRIDLETWEFSIIKSGDEVLDNRVIAWAYNPKDHNIYGVNLSGQFVQFDKETGDFYYVGMTGLVPGSFSQSMVYSPLDHKFVWAAIFPDQTSCIFTIDPETGTAQSTHRYDYANQYTVLYTPDQLCADNAPGLAEIKSLTFEGASQNGKGVVTLPSVYYSGNTLSGEVFLTISDGRTILHSELKGNAGEDVEFELTLSDGLHNISAVPFIKVDGEKVEGHPVYKEVYVGYDTPATPQNVVLTETSVTWNAVGSIGANGGFVDVNDVTYNVYINGVKQNETPVTTNTLDITIPDANLDHYTAEVEAIAGGKVSERGVSATQLFGHAFTLPYYAAPNEEDYSLFTVTSNGYGFWVFNQENEEPFYHVCHADYAADDWVFLPLIKFDDTSHLYEISFDARCRLAEYGNVVQLALSKTTNPDDAEIFHTISFSNKEYVTFRKMFDIPEAGEYHLAIRCASYTDGFYMYLKDINVKATDNIPDCPAMCDYLTATAAKKGELKATVSFTMPRRTIAGGSLYTQGNGEITATIKSDVESKTVTGAPGSRQSVEIATVQGQNVIYVTASNGFGDGEQTHTMVYTGEDIPTYVDINIDASEDNNSAIIKWKAPTEGVNGGYLNPDNLVYKIYNNHPVTGEWIELGEVKGASSYTHTLPAGARLQMMQLGVTVSNEYGGGEQLTYATVVVGPPHELPMVETFNGVVTYEPIMQQPLSEEYTGSWTFYNPAEIDANAANSTGYALVGFPSYLSESLGRIALPKFSTIGTEKAELKMRFFVAGFMPDTDVILCGYGNEEVVLGTVTSADGLGWVTKTFPFPEQFQNRKWAYIALCTHFNGSLQYLMMDSYSIKDPVAQDVVLASIEGAKATMVGNTEYYSVTVENNGFETIAVPDVKCELVDEVGNVARELEASDIPMQTELEAGEQIKFEFEFIPTVDYVGNYSIRASFENGDMIADNNSKEIGVNIKLGSDPIVTDLRATIGDDKESVTLNWSAPVLTLGLEDFEDMTSFAYDEKLGEWTNIDGDGCSTWIFESWSYPDNGLPKGFQVFDFSQAPVSESLFEAYSGDKYLMAISPDDMVTAADDWLISPEVNGGSVVSFMLGIINQIYSPEHIEVMYSSTTPDRESFRVVEKFSKSTLGWEVITTQLPDDAKYFAIHYVSTNTFGIMIDDIKYSPVGEDAEIVGYNIYRDGKKIAEKVADTTYVDNEVAEEDYCYNVTVVVSKNGEEREYPMSNNAYAKLLSVAEVSLEGAVYSTPGHIVISGIAGETYSIYAANGVCVVTSVAQSSTEEVAVEPGIYLVRTGGGTIKILVK